MTSPRTRPATAEYAPSKRVEEPELAPAVGELPFTALGLVEERCELDDLLPKRLQALEHDRRVVGEIARLHSDRRLALDAGEAGGQGEPLLNGADALVGEPVMRAIARLARRLFRAEIAKLRQPLRLSVDLALGAGPVEPLTAPRHLHQVMWPGPVATDQVQDDVGEVGELG